MLKLVVTFLVAIHYSVWCQVYQTLKAADSGDVVNKVTIFGVNCIFDNFKGTVMVGISL